jgi:Flp pilus assembly protein TadG
MRAVRSERGSFSVGTILALVFFAALVFFGLKILPPYIANYQLQSAMDNLARTATYSKMSEQEIREEVLTAAEDAGVELDPSQVAVKRGGGGVQISAQYDVVVDLLFRNFDIAFAPAAGNRNITAR